MRNMRGTLYLLIGFLAVFILFTSLANAAGEPEPTSVTIPTIVAPKIDGWWEVSLFGTSIDQNKKRGVVADNFWVFVGPPTCDQYGCYSYASLYREDTWVTIGWGNLTLPLRGNNVWFYFNFNGDFSGNLFHFWNEMEGVFTNDRWDCSPTDCSLFHRASGRITLRK